MKRTFDREQVLSAFRCDLAALESLLQTLSATFKDTKYHISISVKNGGEEFDFGSVEEVRQHAELVPLVLRQFRVGIFGIDEDGTRSCYFHSGSLLSRASVRATGPDVAWTAGVTEVVKDFAQRNSRWYKVLRPWVFWLLATVTSFLPGVSAVFGLRKLSGWSLGSLGYLTSVSVLWMLFFLHHVIFPDATIITRPGESWPRRYATEIATLTALISLMISLFSLAMARG